VVATQDGSDYSDGPRVKSRSPSRDNEDSPKANGRSRSRSPRDVERSPIEEDDDNNRRSPSP
jgi:arginine/serine-rich splicing factor 7